MARTSDLILMMCEADKADIQRPLLEKELETVGIRLNKRRPQITFKRSVPSVPSSHARYNVVFRKASGGITFNKGIPRSG